MSEVQMKQLIEAFLPAFAFWHLHIWRQDYNVVKYMVVRVNYQFVGLDENA